jgi:hypothetical protein
LIVAPAMISAEKERSISVASLSKYGSEQKMDKIKCRQTDCLPLISVTIADQFTMNYPVFLPDLGSNDVE